MENAEAEGGQILPKACLESDMVSWVWVLSSQKVLTAKLCKAMDPF